MEIRYRCVCMADEVGCIVRDRREGEDIIDWVENVVKPGLGVNHAKRSPFCREKKVAYVKIPLEDGAQIGTPATRH